MPEDTHMHGTIQGARLWLIPWSREAAFNPDKWLKSPLFARGEQLVFLCAVPRAGFRREALTHEHCKSRSRPLCPIVQRQEQECALGDSVFVWRAALWKELIYSEIGNEVRSLSCGSSIDAQYGVALPEALYHNGRHQAGSQQQLMKEPEARS